MEKKISNTEMPAMNQVFKEAAEQHLAECGLPESLIEGVDCSTYQNMEQTLAEVKACFYSSIKKHIEDTYGTAGRGKDPLSQWKKLTEYQERSYWEMFKLMDCTPENNKYIANLHSIISMEMPTGEFSKEWKRLEQKETLLIKILKTGINEEDADKLNDYLEVESAMRWQLEKESFICGFRTAFHLFNECRI